MANTKIPVELSSTPGIVDNSNATAITIDSSENVGIGTDSPSAATPLTAYYSATSQFNIGGPQSGISNNVYYNGSAYVNRNTSAGGALLQMGTDGSFAMRRATSGGSPTLNYSMYIDGSGNVGIGTASPTYPLAVSRSGAGTKAFFTNTTDADLQIVCTSGVSLITPSTGTLALGTSSTERMRIDSSGNVGIGQGTSSAVRLGVTSAGTAYAAYLNFQNGGTGMGMNATSGGTQTFHFYFSNGTYVGQVYTTGSTTVWASASDYRLKENVVTDWDATTRLKQLKPSRFNFIKDADTTMDGFLAHEVQDIVPEAVVGEKDAVDADGNPKYQGIDQSKLVPLLTKALQEQQTIIESLEARITALES